MKNSKLAEIFKGKEDKYPHELEKQFERVLSKIADMWGTSQLEEYFTELLVDKRGGRQGFPKEVATEIFHLSNFYQAELERSKGSDIWGSQKIKDELEQKGFKYNVQGFHKSIESNDRASVLLFIKSGMDINIRGDGGWTPLMVACFNGSEEIAFLLIDHGAKVDARDNNGYMPIHWAAFNGYTKVIELLIAKGADANAANNYGWTPLLQAAARGHDKTAELLLAKGAHVNASDNTGWTPLHKAAANGHIAVTKVLLAVGADVNAKYEDGTTAFMMASKKGYKEVTNLLLDAKAKVSPNE